MMLKDKALAHHSAVPVNRSRVNAQSPTDLIFKLGIVSNHTTTREQIPEPIAEVRSSAKVEVPLSVSSSDSNPESTKVWMPILEARGFIVQSNSNVRIEAGEH
jgi:hypothetical protein